MDPPTKANMVLQMLMETDTLTQNRSTQDYIQNGPCTLTKLLMNSIYNNYLFLCHLLYFWSLTHESSKQYTCFSVIYDMSLSNSPCFHCYTVRGAVIHLKEYSIYTSKNNQMLYILIMKSQTKTQFSSFFSECILKENFTNSGSNNKEQLNIECFLFVCFKAESLFSHFMCCIFMYSLKKMFQGP